MRQFFLANLTCGLLLGSTGGIASENDNLDAAETPPLAAVTPAEPRSAYEYPENPDEPWDSRRHWYCNAAPFRWPGTWDRRDYEAFGQDFTRVHTIAERKCERFHRVCVVWCERRHAWEWDGGSPNPADL